VVALQHPFANTFVCFLGPKFACCAGGWLVCPMPNWWFLLGYFEVGVLLGLLVCFFVLAIAMCCTNARAPHPFLMISTVLLGATIFSLAGFVNAVYAKKFDDIAIIPTFILTPLTYLGGVFYSVRVLPEWAQNATHANPIFYMVNAFRYGLLGDQASDLPVWTSFGVMLFFVLALGWLGLRLLTKGVGLRS